MRFLAPLGALMALAAVLASGAAAASSDVSSNWAGYSLTAADPLSGLGEPFTNVSGTWVQPAAKCTGASVTGATASAFWVGIGGDSEASQALEQTGTEADCTASGTAKYSAWYELVPAAAVKVKLPVSAGDRISGSVKVSGTQVTVQLRNLTRSATFTRTLTMATPDQTSAEWVAEAPSSCSSYGRCVEAALTNFGTVKFANAQATTADGHTGTISDPTWAATAITLDSASGDPFSRFSLDVAATQATPSGLTSNGAAFSVTWAAATSVGPGGATPSGPGFGGGGYGGGYPGGGGYGGGYFG